MARQHLAIVLVRVVLPAAFVISIALRPFGLSILYAFMFFISGLVPVPDTRTFKGFPGRFILLNIILSTLLLLSHVAWHATLYSFPPYGSLIDDHPEIGEIAQNIGFIKYYNISVITGIHYLAPELVMFLTSSLVYFFVSRLLSQEPERDREKTDRHQQYPMLTCAGKYLCLIMILLCGIIRPSVTSGIYFLAFMGFTTAWSLGKSLERGFAVVCRCLMFIMSIHVLVLLVYQVSYLQDLEPPDENYARYFGLTRIIIQMGLLVEPQYFDYDITRWSTLVNPLLLLFTYYILAIETRELLKPKVSFSYISSTALRGSPGETTPLMTSTRHSTSSKKWSRTSSSRLQQDSTGSVVVPDSAHSGSVNENDMEPTLADDLMTAVIDFFRVLVRSSYIATTIIMMAWSILFHSWLTFVFLMWANIVWLCHNQRSFMLKTSPVLVIYAMLLLIAQYIYGMDLTEAELPSNITDVNLRQIGLGRTDGEPFLTLLIKSLFTCMFWVTLRQRVQEIRTRRRSAVIADMAAPLQLTVSAAASALTPKEDEGRSRLLSALGKWLQAMCARYWIYVVVIMLFVIGITGTRMTIFRILYMFLFLAFILMFQISWYWWRRFLYTFWITVIIYSMINLILIYIYQFDNFPKLIEEYLLINIQLQNDLGLEPYPPADLFVKLLTPTCFLIITIMQVHYFHRDFMALSEIRDTSQDPQSSRPSQTGVSTIKDDVPALPSEEAEPISMEVEETKSTLSERSMSSLNTRPKTHKTSIISRSYIPTTSVPPPSRGFRSFIVRMYILSRDFLNEFKEQFFMFLHLHLLKIILISLMLLSVINVCAMHLPIMIIVSPALLFSAKKQRYIVILLSVMISTYFMSIMVYQINYINHGNFAINCSGLTENNTETIVEYNNAEWIGFNKVTKNRPLAVLLKGYIAMIALFTFNSLVYYRQRLIRGSDTISPSMNVMYPEIKREHADKDLIHCAKYLLNFCFYKFGVEMTLICLIGVIGSRMDMYAVMYAFWLLVLVSSSRVRLARFWPVFTAFVMIVTPLQYFIALGFCPWLCMELPWAGFTDQMKHIRTWFFLPYNQSPPPATKLIFDYFLLVFVSRQLFVFRIEKKYGDAFNGGSNKEDIGENWETLDFVNPVPDFLGNLGSWLDVVKRVVFLGMLWITLAIMFLTGTNRVNLFSIGYLVGSFIFLWQGTDFYLRPKSAILHWWSWLLRYNVSAVVIKTLLQIPGCLFSTVLQDHACWLVQLLGIGCVDKFAGGSIAKFIKMQYVQDAKCAVPQEDIGLAWDGVCFAFLILQRRLFQSYYFYRVIDESKATTILASRGAELMEELRQKIINVQEEQETKILEKIKVKMEKIKANQKKVQGILTNEPRTHDTGDSSFRRREFAKNHKAVRSGDYYMFEEFDDVDDVESHTSSIEEEEDVDAPKQMGIGELLSTVIRTDLRQAVRRGSAPYVSVGSDRRMSLASHPRSLGQENLHRTLTTQDDDIVTSDRDRDTGASDIDDFAPPPQKESIFDKLKHYMATAWLFISSILVTITRHLMKFSRDYRYVSRTLSVEKKLLKEKEGFGIGLREGSQMIWEPLPETLEYHKDVTTLEEQDDSMFRHERSPFIRVGYALWFSILAHTDIVCYIMVFINQVQSATILSIPLPLMVFLWGTLTIPRPTKTFWVTLIAYTEVIVLIKSMFQFEILPWNQKVVPANMPFAGPRIIGIERVPNYALYDLLLLLIIFFHRFMLKSLGLWKESTPEVELRENSEYPMTDEDFKLVTKGKGNEVGRKYIQLHDGSGPKPDEDHEESDFSANKMSSSHHDDEQAGPSKAPEDDHYEVHDDMAPIIAVTTTLEDTYKNYPKVIVISIKRYLRPMREFFRRMRAPGARVTADVYAYMFLCDFFNFLVVIFGFAAFGTHQGDGGVQAYLEENKVPIPFLIMLILQFALIIIDRALYLRKYILGKILFQYALIIGVHIWMFFVLPFITERTFNALLPPPMWYMIKCFYLLLSAYQIRCGYPRRIIGNFLCKSYRFLNMISFRGFMMVPFVFELRTLMDWIWTDTSMTLMDWLKMEDIFANVFLLKCSRNLEDKYPQERGAAKSKVSKYMVGGTVLAFVIAIIWFPLVFFAFGNTVGEPNPPTDVTVKLRIGPYLPIYQMSAQSHNIDVYTETNYNALSNLYARDRTAQTFLSNYLAGDVAAVNINPNSAAVWAISPPELHRLIDEAASNSSLTVKFTYVVTHLTNAQQNPSTIESSREVVVPAEVDGKRNPQRNVLLNMLNTSITSDEWFLVKTLFPKFVKVFNKGTVKPTSQLMPVSPEDTTEDPDRSLYRDVYMRLDRVNDSEMFWQVKEYCGPDDPLVNIPLNDCHRLVMFTFNDKLFPETLNFISGSGIIGLYTTFVFLASRVLRGFFSGIYAKIMFDDLPNVDRVLQLCLDIYLVREALELTLEEDLFAKLVFLYRSPETMIKWSRPKDEVDEQRALPPQ